MQNLKWVTLSFLLVLLAWRILEALTTMNIYAKFSDLRPLPIFVDVLYKGIKVGTVVSSKHSDDYEYTILKIKLPKKMVLPDNVFARLMIEKRRFRDYDYIEIIKPQEISENRLQARATISGDSMVDMKNYFANQNKNDIELVKENLYKASESLLTTIDGIGALFSILQDVVLANQTNISNFSKGLAIGADNFGEFSTKINSATKQEYIEDSFSALRSSLQNFDSTTSTIKSSVPIILDNVTITSDNLKGLTSDVSNTLKSPFGGVKLLFGSRKSVCN